MSILSALFSFISWAKEEWKFRIFDTCLAMWCVISDIAFDLHLFYWSCDGHSQAFHTGPTLYAKAILVIM